jgi:hypothetical protein
MAVMPTVDKKAAKQVKKLAADVKSVSKLASKKVAAAEAQPTVMSDYRMIRTTKAVPVISKETPFDEAFKLLMRV